MNSIERVNDRVSSAAPWSRWLAGLLVALGFLALTAQTASAETRTLKLHFIHTGEKAEITFKRNGRYDQAGLKKLNKFLRDWRRNEPTKMDPRLFDVVWEAYKQSGARGYINVVSAYRSPATNSMLRKRSKGVADKSQHMLGKAMDFYIPDVKLAKLRAIGLKLQAGGVGYYPRSGSPFVHFDVGNVRHWPKMSRKELAAVFPNGKTLHVPSDGKPLPGYEQALASYKARRSKGDLAIASASSEKSSGGGLLAAFFGGGGADDEEDSNPEVSTPTKALRSPKSDQAVAVAALERPAKSRVAKAEAVAAVDEKPIPGIQVISPEAASRAEIPAAAEAEETPETIIAALPARSIPLPEIAPRPKAELLAEAEQPAQPASVPFGQAAADAAPAAPDAPAEEKLAEVAEVAFNVPVPTFRPDLPAVAVAQAVLPDEAPLGPKAEDPVLLALAEEQSARSAAAKATELLAPVPSARPDADAQLTVAALAASEGNPAADADAALEVDRKENADRVAALEALASPKLAVGARPTGIDPARAVGSGVKTTRKSARPAARDSRPEPRPVVVAAAPDDARWAFDKEYVARKSAGTKAPSFAYNIVRTAPREVYVAGFQQGAQADAHRFTGKAVTFLSVARFETN